MSETKREPIDLERARVTALELACDSSDCGQSRDNALHDGPAGDWRPCYEHRQMLALLDELEAAREVVRAAEPALYQLAVAVDLNVDLEGFTAMDDHRGCVALRTSLSTYRKAVSS